MILSVVAALIDIGAFLYKNDKEENKPQGYNPKPSQPQEYQPRGQTISDNSSNENMQINNSENVTVTNNITNIYQEKKQEDEEKINTSAEGTNQNKFRHGTFSAYQAITSGTEPLQQNSLK